MTIAVAPAPHLPVSFGIESKASTDEPPFTGMNVWVKMNVDSPRVADGKGHVAGKVSIQGTDLIKFDKDVTSPAERKAAGPIFDAIAGSDAFKSSQPYVDEPLADNMTRVTFGLADGSKRQVLEPGNAPDLPGNAELKAALDAYQETIGLDDIIGGSSAVSQVA